MKKILYSLLSLLITVSCILIVSCNDSGEPSAPSVETLDVPTNVSINNRIVTWDAVKNASGYSVKFNGVEYESAENSFDLHFHADGGKCDIQVKAIGDEKSHWSSDWSEKTAFTLCERVAEGYDENNFYYTLLEDGSGYILKDATQGKLDGFVTVPDYFSDYPVKEIAHKAFGFEKIGLFDSLIFTGGGYNNVTTGIKLPARLEVIDTAAFMGATKLEEVVIPDSVTEIRLSAFKGCTNLRRVVLPKGLKVIPQDCFKNTALSEINLPDTLEEIGSGAFQCTYYEENGNTYHITSELSSIVIPSSVKRIGGAAFSGREKLENVVIPSTVEFIENAILYKTKWYENQPDGLLLIGEGNCFLYGYKGEIPNGIVDNIPSHVKGICGRAFYNSNVQKIVIPDGVQMMGIQIFSRCAELSEVRLPSNLEFIPKGSFSLTSNLKSIILPSSITDIDDSAFYSSGLEKIRIPGSCKRIGERAFSSCNNLSEVIFEEGLEKIECQAFAGTILKNVILPDSLKYLFDDAFYSDKQRTIETVYIPCWIDEYFFCPVDKDDFNLTHIYFRGDDAKWEEYVEETYRHCIDSATARYLKMYEFDCVYFYSEEKPETPGKYWHYVDGKITVWTYE